MISRHTQQDIVLRPIQTQYRGYLFRSRLEARWAVFFDAIGADWTYELEGYHLPSGWYLPDFYVRTTRQFFEVKPRGFDLHSTEADVCGELADASGDAVVIVAGDPFEAFGNHFAGLRLQGGYDYARASASRDLFSGTKFFVAAKRARQARFEHGAHR